MAATSRATSASRTSPRCASSAARSRPRRTIPRARASRCRIPARKLRLLLLATAPSGAFLISRPVPTPIRTRIAPSPTGFLHLGTARTALYSWAFARHHGGEFVLRIEDTDVARSTQDSVDQIIAAMNWLGLGYDEGPVYQMQRLDRYEAVVGQMLAAGTAYHCYCTPDDLDRMKNEQEARGEKRRYDGT